MLGLRQAGALARLLLFLFVSVTCGLAHAHCIESPDPAIRRLQALEVRQCCRAKIGPCGRDEPFRGDQYVPRCVVNCGAHKQNPPIGDEHTPRTRRSQMPSFPADTFGSRTISPRCVGRDSWLCGPASRRVCSCRVTLALRFAIGQKRLPCQRGHEPSRR